MNIVEFFFEVAAIFALCGVAAALADEIERRAERRRRERMRLRRTGPYDPKLQEPDPFYNPRRPW